MGMSEDPALMNIINSLNQLLAEINAMKMSVCVLLTYVEQLEKK